MKQKLKDNYEYTEFCKFLVAEKSEKSNRLLEKLKSLNKNDSTEYINFKTELQFKLFLQAF